MAVAAAFATQRQLNSACRNRTSWSSGYTSAMNTTSRLLMLIPVACALLALSACGNKGPLVMPQKPVPIEEQEVVPDDAAATESTPATPVETKDDAETKPADSDAKGNE